MLYFVGTPKIAAVHKFSRELTKLTAPSGSSLVLSYLQYRRCQKFTKLRIYKMRLPTYWQRNSTCVQPIFLKRYVRKISVCEGWEVLSSRRGLGSFFCFFVSKIDDFYFFNHFYHF